MRSAISPFFIASKLFQNTFYPWGGSLHQLPLLEVLYLSHFYLSVMWYEKNIIVKWLFCQNILYLCPFCPYCIFLPFSTNFWTIFISFLSHCTSFFLNGELTLRVFGNFALIWQGLRCCTIPSLICQQKSYASQDAVKVLQDSPFYP